MSRESSIFAVLRSRGPAWNDALPMRAQAGWDDHAAFMDGLTARGFIRLGGPVAEGREFLLIVEAKDEAAVRAAFGADPWEPAGLLVTSSIRSWTVLLDSTR